MQNIVTRGFNKIFQVPMLEIDETAVITYCKAIVERSTTPFEKFDNRFIGNQKASSNSYHYYLNYWSKVLSPKGQTGRLERFLEFEGLTAKDVSQMLAPAKITTDAALPSWHSVLKKLLTNDCSTADYTAANPDSPLPFQELLVPFVKIYKGELKKRTSSLYSLLSVNAHQQLEAVLMGRIATIMTPTLLEEFNDYKQSSEEDLAHTSNKDYKQFVAAHQADKFKSLFQIYPLLARFCCNCVDMFVEAIRDFILRLAKDQEAISAYFFSSSSLGLVEEVSMEVSDQHNGGEAVIILRFTTGSKLVYKPRSLAISKAFEQLCSWVNSRIQPNTYITHALSMDGYGWMGYVEKEVCKSEKEVQQYYERAGILLGITYLLGSTDYHAENLIASGAHPVLVDHETLLQPTYTYDLEKLSTAQKERIIIADYSVLRSHLLPLPAASAGISSDLLSGFGSMKGETRISIPVNQLIDINTDKMRVIRGTTERVYTKNLPVLNGEYKGIATYQEFLEEGFRKVYALFTAEKDELLSPQGPLADFEHLQLRFIFRPTEIYSRLLDGLLKPAYLKDANLYGLRLEMLSRAFLTSSSKPRFWALHRRERSEMINRDIPLYNINSSSGTLTIDEREKLSAYFKESCITTSKTKIEAMGSKDFNFQLEVIRNAISGRYNNEYSQ